MHTSYRDLKPPNVLVMGEDAGPGECGRVKVSKGGATCLIACPLA